MTVFGLIMLIIFAFWTLFTVLIFSAVTDMYGFLRSPLFIIITVVYILIFTIYPLGKRLLRGMDDDW